MSKMSWVSTVLTCIGAAGVVATSAMAVKATPKAIEMLKRAEEEKGDKLTKMEIVKTAAPAYIPAAVTGVATIACVFGSNVLNKHQQVAMASAYALLDRTYKAYSNKVEELYGEESSAEIKEALAKDEYEDYTREDTSGEKTLFWDFNTMQYFEAPFDEVVQKTEMGDGTICYIIATPIENPLDYIWTENSCK